MVDTTDIEKKSLEAHVELCAQRYTALEQRIDDVKQDTAELKTTIQEVHRLVHKMSDSRNSQLIGWGVGIIGFLTAALGYLISHYVLK
jgi:chromosome segregation ATPase|tara:strand:- start:296 stop:559 length:264 start_codon:yes stop_codon:yes gene_type:complete